jgi:hypothetical protein
MKTTKLQRPSFNYPSETKAGRLERAVAVLRDPQGFVQDKWLFLRSKGLSDTEILEALNVASDGQLLRAAGIDPKALPRVTPHTSAP